MNRNELGEHELEKTRRNSPRRARECRSIALVSKPISQTCVSRATRAQVALLSLELGLVIKIK
jgi:hypothetical protein